MGEFRMNSESSSLLSRSASCACLRELTSTPAANRPSTLPVASRTGESWNSMGVSCAPILTVTS